MNELLIHEDGQPNEGLTIEVEKSDGIPVEVWKALGGEGINLLWDLYGKISEQEVPYEWRNSTAVSI